MRTKIVAAAAAATILAGAAHAQSMEKIDPETGNYVPVPNVLGETDDHVATGDGAQRMKNRLSARTTNRMGGSPPRTVIGGPPSADNAQAGSSPFAQPDWWPK